MDASRSRSARRTIRRSAAFACSSTKNGAACGTCPAGLVGPNAAAWVNLGPAPLVSQSGSFFSYGLVTGRATSVAVAPTDATGNTVYLGGAFGGVWKSTNAANATAASVTWTPVTDQEAWLATGAVSVKPDGSVLLVGTGEPDNSIRQLLRRGHPALGR
jgi:hypothetical protein